MHPFPAIKRQVPDYRAGRCAYRYGCSKNHNLVAIKSNGRYVVVCFQHINDVEPELLAHWNEGSLVQEAIRKEKRRRRRSAK